MGSARREVFAGHDYAQRLPEPREVRPGAPAPWAALAPDARWGLRLATVASRLRDARPGDPPDEAAEVVADARRRSATRRSAVLVALFEDEGETHVILTRRSFALRSHRGEIALPGGRSERGESAVATALREAHEEVDLDPAAVRPLTWLTPIATFASGSSIWPIVGVLERPPTLTPDPREVDRVFSVALRDLVADGAFVEERWRRDDPRPGTDDDGFFPIYFFRVPGDLIWGATARVLTELACVALDVDWPDAGRRWG